MYKQTPFTMSLLITVFCMASHSALAEAWANSGKANMVFDVEGLPTHISEENMVWQVDSGTKHQYPKPEVIGDRVLIMGDGKGNPDPYWGEAVNKGGSVVCRDLRSGEQIWRHIVPGTGYGPATYGSCGSPVVVGNRIYIVSLYDVLCLDLKGLADGNQGVQNELELMMRRGFRVPKGQEKPTELPAWAGDVIWRYDMSELDIDVQDATSCTPVLVDGQLWVSTAHEIGYEARGYPIKEKVDGKRVETGEYKKAKAGPNLIVLDAGTGELVALDDTQVPMVFHGAWSSPALVETKGDKAVIYPDGYGVMHGYEVPAKKAPDGGVGVIKELWNFDLNPHEFRYDEQGRRHPYCLDDGLAYKYPLDWYRDHSKWIPLEKKGLGMGIEGGPSEVIAIPTVVENRVYIGLGADINYDRGNIPAERNPKSTSGRKFGPGRFMCLEFDSVRKAPHVRWDDQDVARIQSCASVHNGLVYVTDQAGYLNCYDALSGDVVYRYDFDTSVRERSQILADGKIYIPDDRGFVHVIKEGRDPVLLDKHRIKGHAATIEPTHGAIVIVTPREVMLFSDHVPK